MRTHTLGLFLFLTCSASCVSAAEYARWAIDSASICLDQCIPSDPEDTRLNSRQLNIAGGEIDLETDGGDVIPPSYSLVPFQFHPRDFSLTQVGSINSVSLALRNDPSLLTDDGEVEVFYVPDSREDFGVPSTRDQEASPCDWRNPQECYQLTYNPDTNNGIDASQFSEAPVSLGNVDLVASDIFEDKAIVELTVPDAVKNSMASRINSGQGFHLLLGATEADRYIEVASFNTDRDGGLGADVRPQLIIEADGVAGGVSKDLVRHGSIHGDGDALNGDFYGSGNDDNFSEYGIANFQFSKDDFGVAHDVATVGPVSLTLHHNERAFNDGDMVEFFFTSETAESLGYDDAIGYANLNYDSDLENGIDAEQYTNAPISLGEYAYEPKLGGNPETFHLRLPEEVKAQIAAAINSGDDFHIIIAAPDAESDITFAGLNNAFDPGNPQLTISLDAVEPGEPLDFNGDGSVSAADAALICEQGDVAALLAAGGSLAGDADLSGLVDFSDFLVLSSNFAQPGHYGQGDFDCDGNVAFADFLILSANFGQSGAAASVPEPSSLLLLVAALGSLGILRKQRVR